MTKEIQILRANILGGMNEYLKEMIKKDCSIADDLAQWVEILPEDLNEEMLMEIAGNEQKWMQAINCFAGLDRKYHFNELVYK